jgi:hypothetical protein
LPSVIALLEVREARAREDLESWLEVLREAEQCVQDARERVEHAQSPARRWCACSPRRAWRWRPRPLDRALDDPPGHPVDLDLVPQLQEQEVRAQRLR